MGTEQIAVRVPDDLLSALDRMVEQGRFPSRAAAVRAGIEILAELDAQAAIDVAIVDGYIRQPPTELEDAAAVASLRQAIKEEPW